MPSSPKQSREVRKNQKTLISSQVILLVRQDPLPREYRSLSDPSLPATRRMWQHHNPRHLFTLLLIQESPRRSDTGSHSRRHSDGDSLCLAWPLGPVSGRGCAFLHPGCSDGHECKGSTKALVTSVPGMTTSSLGVSLSFLAILLLAAVAPCSQSLI